ncbi:hypothetical protein GCM10019016_128570 [Streptomyces prasinosporus]|uniref:Uncharacterized protein n=1 Tax=Streptomyces prasinosporus TaxID=68256 RepID=A0ABP6UGX4_9ACTN
MACARHRLPLFAVHESVAFATVTEHVVRQVSGERAGDLAAVVDRHRRMMTSGPAGGGPDVVLDLLGLRPGPAGLGAVARGRLIAGPEGGGPVGGGVTDAARRRVRAARGGAPGGHPRRAARTAPGDVLGQTTYSLFPVRGQRAPRSVLRDAGGRPRGTMLSDWLLAVEADAADWAEERLDLLHGASPS